MRGSRAEASPLGRAPLERPLYALGRGTRPLADSGGFAWPCGVDYDSAGGHAPLWLWEGVAHGQAAARLSLAEALAPTWRSHLDCCGVQWLVPVLERAAGGEQVGWADVEQAYVRMHGRPPERPV